jgi:hypothetical protein
MSAVRTTVEEDIRFGAFEGLATSIGTAAPEFRFLPVLTDLERGEILHYAFDTGRGEIIALKIGRDPTIRSSLEIRTGTSIMGRCVCEIVYSDMFPVHGNPTGEWNTSHGPIENPSIVTLMRGIVIFVVSHPKKDFRLCRSERDSGSWSFEFA